MTHVDSDAVVRLPLARYSRFDHGTHVNELALQKLRSTEMPYQVQLQIGSRTSIRINTSASLGP